MMRVLQRLHRDDRGMTITELTVVLAMLLIILGSFLTVLNSVNQGVIIQQDRSAMNDEARLAVEQIDREVRSGNVLYDPAAEVPATFSMRIYTQANATTRTPAFTCVQWRIDDQQLNRRWWPPDHPEDVSDWRAVASNVVNRDLSPTVPAFALDTDPARNGRTVDITLMVDTDTSDTVTRPVRIQTSLTGRNTSVGFASDACNPAPAG
jgi:type II secretory pathway pseudopilin PulG